jgi:hypothetical protein
MAAKNLPKNGLQKPSKPTDSLHLNQPGRNPEFSVTPLCPIFTEKCAPQIRASKSNPTTLRQSICHRGAEAQSQREKEKARTLSPSFCSVSLRLYGHFFSTKVFWPDLGVKAAKHLKSEYPHKAQRAGNVRFAQSPLARCGQRLDVLPDAAVSGQTSVV